MAPLLLTALLLAPLTAAPAPSPVAPLNGQLPSAPSEVVLEVLGGRATVVQGTAIRTRTRTQGPLRLRDEAYLELGPGSTALLRRPGLSSFRIEGPAALEWARPAPSKPSEDEEAGEEAGEEADSGPPPPPSVLRVLRMRSLEAEVRRGSQVLELPEAWTLTMPRGALHVSQGPSGLRLTHRGGLAIPIHPRAPRDGGPAPTPLRSGGRYFLAPVDDRSDS